MNDPDLIYAVCVLFGASLVRVTLGFGDALIAMPLLALALPVSQTTPIVTLVSTTNSFAILVSSIRHIDFSNARRLLLGSCLGVPLGLVALSLMNESWLKFTMGIMIASFAVFSVAKPNLLHLQTDRWAFAFGGAAGAFGGAFNAHGPPLVVYGALRRWEPDTFRATLQAYFLPAGLLTLTGHGVAGLWNARVLEIFLYAIPFAVIAWGVGSALKRRIPQVAFVRMLYGILILLGVFLAWQALSQLVAQAAR